MISPASDFAPQREYAISTRRCAMRGELRLIFLIAPPPFSFFRFIFQPFP